MEKKNSLARRSSEQFTIEPLSKIPFEHSTVIVAWVTMIYEHKQMPLPERNVLMLTWLEPLSSFPLKSIDLAFRDYLRNGAGEWFEVHAITKRCEAMKPSLKWVEVSTK